MVREHPGGKATGNEVHLAHRSWNALHPSSCEPRSRAGHIRCGQISGECVRCDCAFLSRSQIRLPLPWRMHVVCEIRELQDQLSKEKLYLEDEIRTEMNFAQIIGIVLLCVESSKTWRRWRRRFGRAHLWRDGDGKRTDRARIHDLSPRRSKPFVKLNCAAYRRA